MRIFDYECKECNFIFEDVNIYHDDQIVNCHICHKPMDKLITKASFSLIGDCWAKDGYTKKNK